MGRKVLIVEDEALIAKDLSFIVEDMGVTATTIALSFEDAVEQLEQENYDLILLDINLSSDRDGIDLAHIINDKFEIPFIFITSYYNSSTVARAKKTRPLAYLSKPFNKHDIQINVEMALYKVDHNNAIEEFYIREKSGTIKLELGDIKYLEAQDNYTKIYCANQPILVSQTLKSLLSKLPSDDFVRTHKSFAVRMDAISMIKGGQIYIEDTSIPIGRSYKADFKSRVSII